MKRFHVHAHVDDLAASIAFYTRLFGAEPIRVEADYAKWMIEDPRLNFAISTRGSSAGIDHLGIQADTELELAELKERAGAADAALLDEGATTCCTPAAAAWAGACCASVETAQAAAECSPGQGSRGASCCASAAQARPGRCC